MKRFSKLGAFFLVLCLALPAAAMGLQEAKNQLDTAKQQGLVGETPTGYLDVVKASGNAQGIVDAINQARRDELRRNTIFLSPRWKRWLARKHWKEHHRGSTS